MKAAGYRSIVALVAVCVGCAGRSGAAAPRPNTDLITHDEVVEAHFTSAYEVINALRPTWLQVRAQSIKDPASGLLMVYLDGTRMGGVEFLRQFPVAQLESAQFLGPTEATARFGSNHVGGAILLVSRRR